MNSDHLFNCLGKQMTWYVIFRGRRPGVYDDWGLCQAQVSGFSHSGYKKFKTPKQVVHAYQVFLQSTSAKVHEDRTQNGPPIMPEIKSMKLFPWKDVIMRLVLIRSLSSTKHLLTGKNRKPYCILLPLAHALHIIFKTFHNINKF